MKNKKSIAMAMAAVSTLGAVAPAFANEIAPLALDGETVDYRLANGEEFVLDGSNKVLVIKGRENLYNDNFTPNDKSDDTFKATYKDAQIFMTKNTNDKDDTNDLYVLVKKASDASNITMEKAKLDAMIAEIEAAKKAGATVKVGELKKANIVDNAGTDEFKPSEIVVSVTPKGETNPKKYTFKNVPGIEEEKEVVVNPFKGLTETANVKVANKKEITDDEKKAYYALNKFKLVAEQNKDKFDFVKEQDETTNTNLLIKVYKKDDKVKTTPVFTMTLENFANLEKTLVVNIPQTNDFAGHWAQKEIVEAMIAGQVDVAANYRPQDSITRAEFAKIACTVFGIKYKKGDIEPFNDVNKNEWYYEYVTALYNKQVDGVSVVQGDGDNFRPNDKITRQEVAVIVAKLTQDKLKISGVKLDTPQEIVVGTDKYGNDIIEKIHLDVTTNFLDDKDIANWADDSVKYLNETVVYGTDKKPVVEGNEKKFNPTQNITRSEALVMVQRSESAVAK